jgi:hypothetical protein
MDLSKIKVDATSLERAKVVVYDDDASNTDANSEDRTSCDHVPSTSTTGIPVLDGGQCTRL